MARRDHLIARHEIAARQADEAGRAGCIDDRHLAAVDGDILLDHHAVGASGQGGTGEDARRLPCPDRPGKAAPRRRGADHVEHGTVPRIVVAHRIAVHHRDIGARAFEGGDDWLREDAPGGLG